MSCSVRCVDKYLREPAMDSAPPDRRGPVCHRRTHSARALNLVVSSAAQRLHTSSQTRRVVFVARTTKGSVRLLSFADVAQGVVFHYSPASMVQNDACTVHVDCRSLSPWSTGQSAIRSAGCHQTLSCRSHGVCMFYSEGSGRWKSLALRLPAATLHPSPRSGVPSAPAAWRRIAT